MSTGDKTQPRSSIRSKILYRIIPLVVAPVLLLAIIATFGIVDLRSEAEVALAGTEQALGDDLVGSAVEEKAKKVADQFAAYFAAQVGHMQYVAASPHVVAAAKEGESAAAQYVDLPLASIEAIAPERRSLEVSPETTRTLRGDIGSVWSEIFLTEANGLNIASTGLTSDFVQNDEEWWQNAWESGLDISAPEFDDSAEVLAIDISVRVDDPVTGDRLGVMKAVLNVDLVNDLTSAAALNTDDVVTVVIGDGRTLSRATSTESTFGALDATITATNSRLVYALGQGTSGSKVDEDWVTGFARVGSTELGRLTDDFAGAVALPTDGVGDWLVLVERPHDVAFASLDRLAGVQDTVDDSQRNLALAIAITLGGAILLAAAGAILVARRVTVPLRDLAEQAKISAEDELPRTVSAIGDLDADEEAPRPRDIVVDTNDELEDLADAMNTLQQTATDLAVDEAIARRQRTDLFLNLGRRNQNLVSKQLEHLENLERTEADPEALDSLLRVDHLATRMRRNAESLLVLAGLDSPRKWSVALPARDIMRAAASEIADYERATFNEVERALIRGESAGDVIHLLAELIENAARFSSPDTTVDLFGRWRGTDYSIFVVDHGVGMAADRLADVNERLRNPDVISEHTSAFLGLQVVGRLAKRHSIKVEIVESPYGGTTARVLLPSTMLQLEKDTPQPETEETLRLVEAPAVPTAAATDEAPEANVAPADEPSIVPVGSASEEEHAAPEPEATFEPSHGAGEWTDEAAAAATPPGETSAATEQREAATEPHDATAEWVGSEPHAEPTSTFEPSDDFATPEVELEPSADTAWHEASAESTNEVASAELHDEPSDEVDSAEIHDESSTARFGPNAAFIQFDDIDEFLGEATHDDAPARESADPLWTAASEIETAPHEPLATPPPPVPATESPQDDGAAAAPQTAPVTPSGFRRRTPSVAETSDAAPSAGNGDVGNGHHETATEPEVTPSGFRRRVAQHSEPAHGSDGNGRGHSDDSDHALTARDKFSALQVGMGAGQAELSEDAGTGNPSPTPAEPEPQSSVFGSWQSGTQVANRRLTEDSDNDPQGDE